MSAHLFPVARPRRRRRVTITGSDAERFRLAGDGGELVTVGERPALTGRIGDEFVVNVTSLDEPPPPAGDLRSFQLRVLVSRKNLSPPRFVRRTSSTPPRGDCSADAYRYDVAGTPLRMRQTASVSDDDVDDYNRAVTFSLDGRAAPYLSIDPVTGRLSSGRVLRASPGGVIRTSVVATNAIASPRLSSSVDLAVYVCDLPGKRITQRRTFLRNCITTNFGGDGSSTQPCR